MEWIEDDSNGNSPEVMTAEVDPSMAMPDGGGANELPMDMSEWSTADIAAYNALRSKRKKCCIGGCTPRSLPIARSYHQLPVRNQEVWAKWVEIIRWSRNDPGWIPSGDAAPLVCSRHFPDSDFISYEASSRVRLSHSAIPMYYVDPPEGTDMDTRFSNPLPVPLVPTGARVKVVSKAKQAPVDNSNRKKIDLESFRGAQLSKYKLGNNFGYNDGDEMDEQGQDYDDGEYFGDEQEDGSEQEALGENSYYQTNAATIVCTPELPPNSKIRSSNGQQPRARLSAPPSLIKFQNHNVKGSTTAVTSKPPGLIRTNFLDTHKAAPRSTSNSTLQYVSNGSGVLKKDVKPVISRSNQQPTKHKIGLAKCRLIVQTLENQLKIAKMRLAEQLDIPYQLVHGVWNMRDSLKDKL